MSAPYPLAINGTDGRVMIEFDLDSPTLPFSLEFLGYDWRGGGGVDDYDEIPDEAIYTDNPRGILELSSFRGYDRVFNWQEIYNCVAVESGELRHYTGSSSRTSHRAQAGHPSMLSISSMPCMFSIPPEAAQKSDGRASRWISFAFLNGYSSAPVP